MSSKVIAKIIVNNNHIIVSEGAEHVAKILGYTSPPSAVSFVEAAYLVYSGNAKALDPEGHELSFQDVISKALKHSPYAWVVFEVYLDLKRRGKIPIPGPRSHSLLLKQSKRTTRFSYYILVLEESRRISIEELLSFLEESMHNNWEPVVAIVDRYGDITYYSLRPLHPRREAAAHPQ